MNKYPEHDKVQKIAPQSQAIGEFLEWLQERGTVLAEYDGDRLWPQSFTTETLLAKFFDIDLNKLEKEKREMLKEIRLTNRKK